MLDAAILCLLTLLCHYTFQVWSFKYAMFIVLGDATPPLVAVLKHFLYKCSPFPHSSHKLLPAPIKQHLFSLALSSSEYKISAS